MPATGGIGGPLLYAVAAGWIGLAAAAFYQAIWVSIVGPATLPFGLGLERAEFAEALAWFESWAGLVAQVVFGGISVTIGVFVASGLLHLMLMLLGGAPQRLRGDLSRGVLLAGDDAPARDPAVPDPLLRPARGRLVRSRST